MYDMDHILKMKRYRKIAVWIVCIIALFGLFWIIPNTRFYLEWRVHNAKEDISALVMDDNAELQSIANVFYNTAGEDNIYLFYDKYNNNLPQDVLSQVEHFLQESPAKIDEIYVGGQTILIYPKNVCVFRREIWQGDEIYAWINLIYAPPSVELPEDWAQCAQQLTSDWYIHVLYGF